MRLSGHEINSQLPQKLDMPTGRHLYVVLGTYERIERYERVAFREARSPDDKPLGPALNINHSLLQRFGDEELKWLVRNEAGMQETVKESAMLYIRAERFVRRSICRIDGMDTRSGG